MLQHVGRRAQRLAEHGGGLLDDRGVGNDVDHPAQPMPPRMLQREGQRRQCLAATGGHGQREQPRRRHRHADRMVQHVRAQPVQPGVVPTLAGEVVRQPRLQRRQVGQRRALGSIIKALRAQEVCVHQAGEQHPGQKCFAEPGMRVSVENRRRSKRGERGQSARMRLPTGVALKVFFSDAAPKLLGIGKSGVMPRNGDVMQQPGRSRGRLPAKRRSKAGRAIRNVPKVISQPFPANLRRIGRRMSKKMDMFGFINHGA